MDFKLVGAPCGEHGPYTFYKAFKYCKNGRTNILALSEFFFVKLWTDSDLISIGELQLLWEDKNNEQTLASLRLYILPENTPEGRCDVHGEDEVLAITEKVVLRVEDLLTWITEAADWGWGRGAVWERDCAHPPEFDQPFVTHNPIGIDMDDVQKEKQQLEASHWETTTGVVVLSYARYCRYRGVLKRLEGVQDKWLKTSLVAALGGFTAPCRNTRVLFCKDTFDYPELEGHELLCNHLAPKLKGRPRRKRKKQSVSPDGSESESESSQSTSSSTSKVKIGVVKPRLRCTLEIASTSGVKRATRGPSLEEKNFMQALHSFMNDRKTPIGRIPVVGFKEVNLFQLFKKVTDLGGYDMVTTGKLWKHVYEIMGGDTASTSAATLSRRHYEKLLLPYERHLNGRAQITKIKSLPSITVTTTSEIKQEIKHEIKQEIKQEVIKQEVKPNMKSLRSIRVKQEKVCPEKENIPAKNSPPVEKAAPSPAPHQLHPVPIKKEPEVIDLVSLDGKGPQVKMVGGATLSPMVKKQKLEILKEGGLEVTPIGGARASVIKAAPIPIKPPPPVSNKISITVTPDMSHLMYGITAGPSKTRPVYGNPKEQLPAKKTQVAEVLDLRTKGRGSGGGGGTQLNIGSNLEITLVPPRHLPPPPPAPSAMPPPKKRPHHHHPPTLNIPQVRSPKVNCGGQQGPGRLSGFHHQHGGKNNSNAPSYIPVMDPIYLQALYNGILSGAPIYQHHGAAPASTPPQHHLSVYKELMRRQGTMFPLLQDGSTSITLVGQTTPTSK